MALLRCEGLVKDYPGKRAVDGVSFEVNEGEIVGLLGPNGAGKSTSFRMACGLIAPTEGRVLLRGKDVTRWPMYQRAQNGLGYLPQDSSIFSNCRWKRTFWRSWSFAEWIANAACLALKQLLNELGLWDKRKQRSGSLSGGERRRLEIARALASDPQIILLDEPLPGLTRVTIHSIQDIITGLRNRGISILLTDHRERETLTITDRSYIICGGRVLVSGDAKTVLSDPEAIASYFGRRFDASSILDGREQFRKSA